MSNRQKRQRRTERAKRQLLKHDYITKLQRESEQNLQYLRHKYDVACREVEYTRYAVRAANTAHRELVKSLELVQYIDAKHAYACPEPLAMVVRFDVKDHRPLDCQARDYEFVNVSYAMNFGPLPKLDELTREQRIAALHLVLAQSADKALTEMEKRNPPRTKHSRINEHDYET